MTKRSFQLAMGFVLTLGSATTMAKTPPKWADHISAANFQVAPPPEAGSAEARQDLQDVLDQQAHREASVCEQVAKQAHADFHDLFKNSSVLKDDEYQEVKHLMNQVGHVAKDIADDFKAQYPRPRPSDEDARVHPCNREGVGISSTVERNNSYPSGHATVGTAISCVLAEVFPDRAKQLEQYADEIAALRVEAGFHHPKDIEAGQKLGLDLCTQLLGNRDFQKKLKRLGAGGAGNN